MADPLFTPEARVLLDRDDREAIQTFSETLHPATVADTLTDSFSIEDTWRFLRASPIDRQAAIFEYFPLEWQLQMVQGTGREPMARLIEEMSSDDRADLLRKLPAHVHDSILRLVDEADRKDIARLIEYPENTAGALMTTDYAWVPENITEEEALRRLKLQAPDAETIYYVYVVTETRKLVGVVSLRDLILAQPRSSIADIMESELVFVHDTDDRAVVASTFADYDLVALPVVDKEGRLVGIITSDDVVDVVVSEATEDAHRMGAISPVSEGYLEASFFKLWRNRAFWLSMLFVAELFTFTALAAFEETIARVVVLSLFVPLCISTGGNSGSQAATLITRSMALGEIENKDWFRVLRHEIAMGIALGITLGAIGFFRATWTPESLRSSSPPRPEPFVVVVQEPLATDVKSHSTWFGLGPTHSDTIVALPPETLQRMVDPKIVEIKLPEDETLPTPEKDANGHLVYNFPAKCTVRQPPVSQYRLAAVIGLAVAGICLWGTLMGSMLPLIFKKLGIDPGIASSPFVATFVDVTGIVIYFSIAKMLLWDVLG